MSQDFEQVTQLLGPPKEIVVAEEGMGTLESWLDVFRVIQVCHGLRCDGEFARMQLVPHGPTHHTCCLAGIHGR